jgi:hypothetical protein
MQVITNSTTSTYSDVLLLSYLVQAQGNSALLVLDLLASKVADLIETLAAVKIRGIIEVGTTL